MNRINLHEMVPPTTDKFIVDFIEKLRSDGLEMALQYVLETNGIEPNYNEGGEETLVEQRRKLETMPGMMIANHPGRFDTIIVLDILKKRILERGDVKFLVAGGQFYDRLVGMFGADIVLSADRSKNPIGGSIKHITENGGLIMIYPTGGQDTEFKSGFKLICQGIPSNSMVYAVQIDEHDLAMTDIRFTEDKKLDIQVHEVFTRADEWTAELVDSEPEEQNHRMTEHYQLLFAEINAQKIYTTESPEDRRKREEQVRLIREVAGKAAEKGYPIYLYGGFADELLLNEGEIKNDHSDIDCIGMRSDAFSIGNILVELGCTDIKYVYELETYEEEELPVKIMARRGVSEIDIVFMDMDEERQQHYYCFVDGEGKKYAIYFDKDFFPKKLEKESDDEPAVISPLGLIQTKLFYPHIKSAVLRDKDRNVAEALRDRFFPGEDLTDKKFLPEIIEVKDWERGDEGRRRLLELENEGRFVFHGSVDYISILEPRQAYNINPETGEEEKDGNPAVFATQFADVAIFRALISGRGAQGNSESKFGMEGEDGRESLHFSATQNLLDKAKGVTAYVYVLDKSKFAEPEGSQCRSGETVQPLEVVKVRVNDLPKNIEVIE